MNEKLYKVVRLATLPAEKDKERDRAYMRHIHNLIDEFFPIGDIADMRLVLRDREALLNIHFEFEKELNWKVKGRKIEKIIKKIGLNPNGTPY